MKSLNLLKPLLIAVFVFAWAVAPSGAADIQRQITNASMIENVLKRGVMRVGLGTFVPWAMKDKTGQLIGLEIDVAKRLAKDMGVDVEFVPTRWAGIIPALLTGKFDIIVGGMGVVPARNLKVNFTIPYYYTGMSMVASRKLAAGFASVADFNRPDVTLAIRLGSAQVIAAQKYMPKAKLRKFDSEAQVYQEVVNGKAHAAIGFTPSPAFQALKYPEKLFLPLKETFTKQPVGLAVRKGDPDSLNFLNNWIRVIQAEGWIQERNHYWFRTKDWEGMMK